MTEEVVVCFRAPELEVEPTEHLASVRVLIERATALGAKLIAWGATTYAFEFEGDAVEDAIELGLATVREAEPGREHGVGISAGVLERTEEPSSRVTLKWGYPLVCATALARAARPGEVLIDPMLDAAKRGELLTIGSRASAYGKLRLRGLILDAKHPWRASIAETIGGIVQPGFKGGATPSDLDPPPGTLTLVRADRGYGGSRFLEGVEQHLDLSRVLYVTPHPFGEPLGPLRRAFLRAVTLGQAPLNLTGEAGRSLEALLAGEGLDLESCAELVRAWLTPDSNGDPRGAVLFDDAGEIDADTLEVVCRALVSATLSFRVIARVAETEAVPPELSTLPEGESIRLPALDSKEATTLAVECAGGHWDAVEAERWAVKSRGLPLGIIESIRDSLESGEVVREDGRLVARLRSSGPSAARPPKHWVRKRFQHQQEDAKRVLEALAALGGQAESRDLEELLARRPGLVPDTTAAVAALALSGWVSRMKPDIVALPSATHRDAVLATLDDAEFHAWHRAASELFAGRERPLSTAAAVVHAVLAGDSARAAALARRAAAATRAMGLERTAAAFERFAELGDPKALESRNLFTSQLEVARAVPSVWPERAAASIAPARASTLPKEEETGVGKSPSVIPDVTDDARFIPSSTVLALRTGDLEEVDRVVEQLRIDEGRTVLAERLEAMAHLARGETGDAIRRLRDAAEEARGGRSRDRCRASLALAVALGAAGRAEEALLEVLDALARARETSDAKGEHTCLRFLGHLATVAGHHDVGEAWASAMNA